MLGAAMLAASCGSDIPDRLDVVATLADDAIAPAYAALDQTVTGLETALGDFCDAPSADGHAASLTAMVEARSAWKQTEAFWLGPVMDRRSWAVVDWPIGIEAIEELIADDAVVLDQDHLSRRIGAQQRGLGAIEYVLSDANLTDAVQAEPRRCEYLRGIGTVAAAEVALVRADWTESSEEGGPYVDVAATADAGSLDALINDALFLLETMADAELGRSLGVMGDEADLEAAVEGPSGLGVSDLADRARSLRTVLVGVDGESGISPLLSGELTSRLGDQLAAVDEALARIGAPLRQAVADDAAAVLAARDALKVLQATVATEVVGALGVTIGFSDADGDAG